MFFLYKTEQALSISMRCMFSILVISLHAPSPLEQNKSTRTQSIMENETIKQTSKLRQSVFERRHQSFRKFLSSYSKSRAIRCQNSRECAFFILAPSTALTGWRVPNPTQTCVARITLRAFGMPEKIACGLLRGSARLAAPRFSSGGLGIRCVFVLSRKVW